jgi:toxin ParE1/3/4
MKSAVFLVEARLEMEEAAQFYDAQETGLGDQFLDAIQRAVEDVSANPRRWPVIGHNVRRRLVGRFPYGILYRVGRVEVVVLAVMHLHRHPHYWMKRIDKRR